MRKSKRARTPQGKNILVNVLETIVLLSVNTNLPFYLVYVDEQSAWELLAARGLPESPLARQRTASSLGASTAQRQLLCLHVGSAIPIQDQPMILITIPFHK